MLSSLSVDYALFDVDGKPLRATCALSIEEAGTDTPRQNPTSGSREARRTHRVVAGDSLAQLAWREYGDATAWRVIARTREGGCTPVHAVDPAFPREMCAGLPPVR